MVHDTISLVRDTKELTLSLHQIDAPADISVEDFSFEITCANGTIGHDNSLWEDERLTYKPYFTWDTDFRDEAGNVKERTAHAAMMFSRLVLYPVAQNEQNAMLSIFNKKTGEEVVRINLADCLAQEGEPSTTSTTHHRSSWTVSMTTISTSSSKAASGSMPTSAYRCSAGASASSV